MYLKSSLEYLLGKKCVISVRYHVPVPITHPNIKKSYTWKMVFVENWFVLICILCMRKLKKKKLFRSTVCIYTHIFMLILALLFSTLFIKSLETITPER